MQALVLTGPKQFELQDMPKPEPGVGDVVVRVMAAGICGSDVHGMDGATGRRRPPIVMGHEAAGVIDEVGPGVRGWSVGDRVTFDSTLYCGVCHFCRRGEVNLCEERKVLGVSCEEYRQHGAFAEFVCIPQHVLYALPDALDFERAAMVEPVAVAVHAVQRAHVTLMDTAVVLGGGVIGLSVVQSLRAAGCGTIVAVDLDDGRLELASKLGADLALHSTRDDVLAKVRERTNGRGADLSFEAVGVTETVRMAVECVRPGGRLALIGNVSPTVELPLQSVVTRELTLLGSCASCGEYTSCVDLMAGGAIDVRPMISAVAPLSEGPAWFERLYNREPGLMKVILKPGE